MVADYTPQTVEKAFASLSVGAVREHYKRSRAMFSYAVNKGWMATNPVLSMDIPTTKQDEVVIAAPETVEKQRTGGKRIDTELILRGHIEDIQ